jgi:hypothetical protein
VRTVELTQDLQPQLQRFYEDNPEYFIAVQGEPAGPNAAYETIQAKPPPGWGFAPMQRREPVVDSPSSVLATGRARNEMGPLVALPQSSCPRVRKLA